MEIKTASYFELVRDELQEVEQRLRSTPDEHHINLNKATEHLLSSGGKRVRPMIVLLTGRMIGADPGNTRYLATAIEMLHTATLVHDDLIDGSRLRRGIPTLNARWTPGATVLTGDYMFARAAHFAAQTDCLPLFGRFAETLMTIVNGEVTQLFRSRTSTERQDYLDRIYAKTASLFELATEGPAMLAELDPPMIANLKRYGLNLGLAFQIVDDVLDFIGNEQRIGKPVGSDLQQGLITLPTILFLNQHPDDPELNELITDGMLETPALSRLLQNIQDSGAVQQAMEEARAFVEHGVQNLMDFPDGDERQALIDLAYFITSRSD